MRIEATGILVAIIMIAARAQFGGTSIPKNEESFTLSPFEASIGIGFNYDLLRDPLDVSFESPKGYFGLNLPLEKVVNVRDYSDYINPAIDSILMDDSLFTNADEFRPTAGARQHPNPTFRVDVPMMGGVASFSNTHNFYLKYRNVLGNPKFFLTPSSIMEGASFILRGTVYVPLDVSASWETMTFGYAFEVNRYVKLALNLHRHVFVLDLRGKVDVDLLGRYNIEMNEEEETGFDIPSISGDLDYSSDKVFGDAYGHYEAEVWSPTLACAVWRFSLIGRMGINTNAHGRFHAKYALPFFLDPETFEVAYDLTDPETINRSDVRQGLLSNASDSVIYSTRKAVGESYQESDLVWKMPGAVTLSFDIIPEKLKISYSKLFGDLSMKLDRIAREKKPVESSSSSDESLLQDTIVIDYGISIDNIIVMELHLFNSFINLGAFGMDFRYAEDKNLLGKEMPGYLKMGKMALLPIVGLGTSLGTKIQLHLEFNILPLPAVKTGIYYYF